MNEQQLAWDDLRTVLAIAATGSLSGAARRLGVSHATVFRRLGAIEQRVGVKLFQRGRAGYTPSAAGEEMAAAAGRIEAEVVRVERRIAGRDLRPAGTVRVTTTDTLLNGLLSTVFAEFQRTYPEIGLDIVVSNAQLSLAKRDADVAVRPTEAPPENLLGRRAGAIAQAVYAAAGTADGATAGNLETARWIGPGETLWDRPLERWMQRHGHDDSCQYRVDSMAGMQAAVRAGAGVAVLPCYLGDADPALVRVGEPIAELRTGLWLLTHPDLRGVARIRAFTGFVGDAIRARAQTLAGNPPVRA